MDPVLGGHVIKGEQCFGLVGDLGDGLRPLGGELVGKGLDGRLGVSLVLGVAYLGQRPAGGGWTDFGRAFSTLAETWNQQRCSAVSGKTSRTAAQNPRAPSPTASTGARIPRRLQSLSRLAQDSVDSR
jgi:hypothetical protein